MEKENTVKVKLEYIVPNEKFDEFSDCLSAIKKLLEEIPPNQNETFGLIDQFLGMLGTNIDTISFDTNIDIWTITYKNGLQKDEVESELLLDFLQNA